MNLACLVIGGGGPGGHGYYAGGGGAGGYQYNSSLAVTAQVYDVIVGAGGTPSANETTRGSAGGNSVFSTITAYGGGSGGSYNGATHSAGVTNGGDGGSSGAPAAVTGSTYGTASQGYHGGSTSGDAYGAGGGGGAGAVGGNGIGNSQYPNPGGGTGGVGLSNSITGSAVYYAGGGGGGAPNGGVTPGGNGGGGSGGTTGTGAAAPTAGTANTGGGGGGAGGNAAGAAGGSGVVIVRYLTADFGNCTSDGTLNVDYTKTTDGDYTVFKWLTVGTHHFTVVDPVDPATVTTSTPAGSITSVSATGGGNVTDDGGGTVSERGVCWGESTNPTIAGDHQASGSGTGVFGPVNMTGLSLNTHYYYRAYATNGAGTAYGANVEFDTLDAVISGVVSIAGTPVQYAKVTLIDSTTDLVVDIALTDVNGAYEFTGLDIAKTYHVTAELDDDPDFYNSKSLPFMVPEEV